MLFRSGMKYENTNVRVVDHLALKMRAFILYNSEKLDAYTSNIKEEAYTFWKNEYLLQEQNVQFSKKEDATEIQEEAILKFVPWGFWIFPFDEKEISGFIDIGNFQKI